MPDPENLPRHYDSCAKKTASPGVWKIACVAMLGSFLAQLDATVVNLSLDRLATDFHAPISTVQWVMSAYLMALALTLPLNGWLVNRFGAKPLYIICFSAFTLSSALCALAWSAGSLIGFRILQGISGGLLAPMAQTVMAQAAGNNLARVVGYISVPVLLAPVFGPVAAGFILHYASWRVLFLANLPFGLLAIVLALLFLPDDLVDRVPQRLDVGGLALLSPGLVLFLYAIERISTLKGQILLTVSVLFLVAFVLLARKKGSQALLDIRLFRGKTFTAAAIAQFLNNGVMFAGQMIIPLFLIRIGGFSPLQTGWMLLPLGLGMMCANPLMGALTQRFGLQRVSAGGAILALAGTLPFLLMAIYGVAPIALALALFLRGAGLSATGIPSMTAAYGSVERQSLPMATTALNIAQRLGGPTLTTLCILFLQWHTTGQASAPPASQHYLYVFALLCTLHAAIFAATLRLPRWPVGR